MPPGTGGREGGDACPDPPRGYRNRDRDASPRRQFAGPRRIDRWIGRRPSCDIRLDFENVSGKHCLLRLINGVWNIKDLGSTNGTTVNGGRVTTEQSVMPDEELGIAGHLFMIDYDPAGPEAFLSSHKELAGLDTDATQAKPKRPKRAPTIIERLSADEAEFDDTVPEHFQAPPKPSKKPPSDDDFFKLIEEEVK
jgi:predicted component of type VI protein secretion system